MVYDVGDIVQLKKVIHAEVMNGRFLESVLISG